MTKKQPEKSQPSPSSLGLLAGLLLFGACFGWAYWPTLVRLVETWNVEPDYSHGFLVPVFALVMLWIRRDRPGSQWGKPAVAGAVALFAACIGLRFASAHYYVDALDGWSMIFALGALSLLIGGWRCLAWSWPSIVFLLLAIPLPYRAERLLSYPLQSIATNASSWTLQLLGQPAITEGHVILLNGARLEVEQACSGLRIFMSIIALAFIYCVLTRTAWWEKVILALATVPVALAANALRIVGTGLLVQYTSGDLAHKFSHDFAGWAMIPVAALMFFFVIWYVRKLFPEVVELDVRDALQH